MDVKSKKLSVNLVLVMASLVIFGAVACSSQQVQMPQYIGNPQPEYIPDTGFVQDAESAVSQAKAEKADAFAPKDFKVSQEKLVQAQDMFAVDDRRESLILAEQSTIDAKVATAKAESVQLYGEIRGLRNEVDQLKQEVNQSR